jgi:hypothetical protein
MNETMSDKKSGLAIDGLCQLMTELISNKENSLRSELDKVKGQEISNGTLLGLQAQVSAWSNLAGIATGTLRAVADAMKSTTLNIR